MQVKEYQNIFEQENKHFYYVSIHKLFLNLVKKYGPDKKLKILDAGCGTGMLAKKMGRLGKVTGVDISEEAVKLARKRGIKVRQASLQSLPFSANYFDLATCVDVIYHRAVKNDQKAISELYRVLKPKGILIIKVPAHPWLRLSHDRFVHTKRRYQRKELVDKLKRAEFQLVKISFVNMTLLTPAIFKHWGEKLSPPPKHQSLIQPIPKFINRILIEVLSWENYLVEKIGLPFGLSLLAVCKKP